MLDVTAASAVNACYGDADLVIGPTDAGHEAALRRECHIGSCCCGDAIGEEFSTTDSVHDLILYSK